MVSGLFFRIFAPVFIITIFNYMGNPFKTIKEKVVIVQCTLSRFAARFAAWQRRGVTPQPLLTDPHVCLNCNTAFTGNFCPRCGQSAGVSRFTFRHALNKTMEVWGLGNRSLPLTLWHLIYRPGYMIGDYLEGRQAPYFPPLKMLFLVTAACILVQHFIAPDVIEQTYTNALERLNTKTVNVSSGEGAYEGKQYVLQGMNLFFSAFKDATVFFQHNQAVELIFDHCLFALLAMRVFRRSPLRPNMNLTECFFSQVFIAIQLLMISTVCVAATGGSMWMDNLYTMPTWLLLLVLLYDYKQLYGFSLLRTAWYTVKMLVGWFVSVVMLLIGWIALSVAWTAIVN